MTSFPPVLNKSDMIRRWADGEFGNSIKCWDSWGAYSADVKAGRWPGDSVIALRYKDPGAPFCRYDLTYSAAWDQMLTWMNDPTFDPSRVWVNDSNNPDRYLRIQGEVARSHRGLELRWSPLKKKMRLALAEDERNTVGLKAKLILEHYLDPCDYDWIMELLDRYPDHVVEFSVWGVPFGVLQRRMIVWECRLY